MFLFQKRFHEGLVKGTVTLSFRLWDKARVKPHGRYRVHPIGVVEVSSVRKCRLQDISEADARAAGFSGLAELIEYMRPVARGELKDSTEVFCIELRHAGDGDYVPAALEANLSEEQWALLAKKLLRLEGPSPWVSRALELISERSHVAASKLAPFFDLPTPAFKERIVKLKKLGLTQSFEVGYALTPLGEAFLRRLKQSAGA